MRSFMIKYYSCFTSRIDETRIDHLFIRQRIIVSVHALHNIVLERRVVQSPPYFSIIIALIKEKGVRKINQERSKRVPRQEIGYV